VGATLYTKMNFTNSFLGTAVLMLQYSQENRKNNKKKNEITRILIRGPKNDKSTNKEMVKVKVKFRLCCAEFSQHYVDVREEVKVSFRVFVHSALPHRYSPCKRTVFSLDGKQNGPQNRSGRGGVEKKMCSLAGNQIPNPVLQPVA